MKNKTEEEIILARRWALTRIRYQGIVSKHHLLDNEISALYRDEIKATGMTFQLVLPDDNRRNLAEKSIQSW